MVVCIDGHFIFNPHPPKKTPAMKYLTQNQIMEAISGWLPGFYSPPRMAQKIYFEIQIFVLTFVGSVVQLSTVAE